MKRQLFIVASLAAAASSQAFFIDDFSNGNFSMSISSGSWVGSQSASVLGGERDAGMVVMSNPLGQSLTLSVGSGAYISSGGAQLISQVGLDYDGMGDETDTSAPFETGPGLGNLNLGASADRFRINFLSNDLALSVTAYIETYGAGGASSSNQVIGANGGSFSADFLFSSFSGPSTFSDVDRIVFIFDTSASGDFALGSLEVVPEPATFAAIGAGVLGLLRRRRK